MILLHRGWWDSTLHRCTSLSCPHVTNCAPLGCVARPHTSSMWPWRKWKTADWRPQILALSPKADARKRSWTSPATHLPTGDPGKALSQCLKEAVIGQTCASVWLEANAPLSPPTSNSTSQLAQWETREQTGRSLTLGVSWHPEGCGIPCTPPGGGLPSALSY